MATFVTTCPLVAPSWREHRSCLLGCGALPNHRRLWLLHPKRRRRLDALTSSAGLEPASTAPRPAFPGTKTGTIIVPGKFDAFHLGHQELARTAAQIGSPVLLSFSGMAEALRWPPRSPVVAAVERDRILRAWSAVVGENIGWRVLPFMDIRDQAPDEFLGMLAHKFQAKGIVCGSDWRFGRRAAGDVELLRKLGPKHGIAVHVVDSVQLSSDGGVVSSTRVRKALAEGDVTTAGRLLGRPHRLVGYVVSLAEGWVNCDRFVNQVPGDGIYSALVRVIGRSEPFRAVVRVDRPKEVDPLTPLALLHDPDAVVVQIEDAEQIYCDECEVYVDFIERIVS